MDLAQPRVPFGCLFSIKGQKPLLPPDYWIEVQYAWITDRAMTGLAPNARALASEVGPGHKRRDPAVFTLVILAL